MTSGNNNGTVQIYTFSIIKNISHLGLVVHAYNPSIWETEAGGSQVRGQSDLHNKNLSRKKKKERKKKTKFHW